MISPAAVELTAAGEDLTAAAQLVAGGVPPAKAPPDPPWGAPIRTVVAVTVPEVVVPSTATNEPVVTSERLGEVTDGSV